MVDFVLENLSNNTAIVGIKLIKDAAPKGWSAELVNAEGKKLDGTQELSESSVLHFILRVKKPDDAKKDDTGIFSVKASCSVKDGTGYVGHNGVVYGGPDESESRITVIVDK